MTINSGKFGNYYACSNYPECKNIKPVNEKVVIPTDQICEKCGGMMVEREGKYGKFLACSNYPKCKNTRAVNEVKSEEKCPKCGEQIGITVLTPDAHPLIHTPIHFMGYVQA